MKAQLEPPEDFPEPAKAVFRLTVKQLGNIAIATDYSLLCDFALSTYDVKRLSDIVDVEGETCYSPKSGCAYINPSYNILVGRRKDLERARHDLGFTPKSRGVVLKTTSTSALRDAMSAD